MAYALHLLLGLAVFALLLGLTHALARGDAE
jgi:hypothetical protein